MPKFLIEASYTAEGLRGLRRDGAAGRRTVVTEALGAAGGTLEAMYFALGERDVMVVADLPDASAAAAVALAASESGLVRTRTTALLTVEEADAALKKTIDFRAPGQARG